MNRKEIEKAPPVPWRGKTRRITVQTVGKTLVLNIYDKGNLMRRHCIQPDGKYETAQVSGKYGLIWHETNIRTALDINYWYYRDEKDKFCPRAQDIKKISDWLETAEFRRPRYTSETDKNWLFDCLENLENLASRTARERKELRRRERVKALMNTVPIVPKDLAKWIDKVEWGSKDYAIKDCDTGLFSCSHCGKEADRKDFGPGKTGDIVKCPNCHRKVVIMPRRNDIHKRTHIGLIQPVCDDYSVMRHFSATLYVKPKEKKMIVLCENIRVFLYRKPFPNGNAVRIYYYQDYNVPAIPGKKNKAYFDFRNPLNLHECYEYLYDGGIEDALKGTRFERWINTFKAGDAAGIQLDYNSMMCGNFPDVMEMLIKGHFYRLAKEESKLVSPWDGRYWGNLNVTGSTIEEIFRVDKQRINRIRDADGGENAVKWMNYEQATLTKISDKTLRWLIDNGLGDYELKPFLVHMSVEQTRNYLERQKKEQYKNSSIRAIINQYKDYILMCEKLHKDTDDQMIFKPRELKKRHDQCVNQIEEARAKVQADEYTKMYPEAEKVLGEIAPLLDYKGDKYEIITPKRIVDIVIEGRILHHCVGSTDRYFDRIKSHETYICFLRKANEPDKPFYTIEVEPGGTIRQHRGLYDEEPELDKVKPFLREWQKAIKKRMKAEDKERAKLSKIKREQNIKELEDANNTRVLQGLKEDFMAAV